MSLTLDDVCERLKQIDEISVMEVLEISSEDMVERFLDRIERKLDMFQEELEDNDQSSD